MSNARLRLGRRVAVAIGETERNVNATIIASANLLITVVEGGAQAGEPAMVAQEAVESLSASLEMMARARARIIAAHENLVSVRDTWGMDPSSFGCNSACLPERTAKTALSVVAAA